MAAVSSKFESGLVFLPKSAPWLADFETELFAFPGSRHDDQCDSVSQALTEENCRFPMVISPEVLAAGRVRRPRALRMAAHSGILGLSLVAPHPVHRASGRVMNLRVASGLAPAWRSQAQPQARTHDRAQQKHLPHFKKAMVCIGAEHGPHANQQFMNLSRRSASGPRTETHPSLPGAGKSPPLVNALWGSLKLAINFALP